MTTEQKKFKITVQGRSGWGTHVFEDSVYRLDPSGSLIVTEPGVVVTVFGPGHWLRVEDPAPEEEKSGRRGAIIV
jgi:hypothetical protein